jgi:hypothetical protein
MAELKKTPLIQMESGKKFVGRIKEGFKEWKGQDKKTGREYVKFIHTFEVVDGDVAFVGKGADGKYGPVDVSEGDEVSIFATKTLHEKLDMFPGGSLLEIKEDGKEDAGGTFKRRKFIVKMVKENSGSK